LEKREKLNASRQARKEIIKFSEGGVGIGRFRQCFEQGWHDLGQNFARPVAADGTVTAVMPAAHGGGDAFRVAKTHLFQGVYCIRVVFTASESQHAVATQRTRFFE